MKRINRTKVTDFMRGLKGRAAGVCFIKKDGSFRTMNARLGVTAGLKGGRKTVGLIHDPYLTVWSFNDQGYRTINLETLRFIQADGEKYVVY